jgi:hypothetical protein
MGRCGPALFEGDRDSHGRECGKLRRGVETREGVQTKREGNRSDRNIAAFIGR